MCFIFGFVFASKKCVPRKPVDDDDDAFMDKTADDNDNTAVRSDIENDGDRVVDLSETSNASFMSIESSVRVSYYIENLHFLSLR